MSDTQAKTGPSEDLTDRRPRGAAIIRPLFRVIVTVSALLLLAQPVLAGRSLDGDSAALGLHFTVGVAFLGVAILQDIVGLLWWKPAGGAGWVPLVAIASHLTGLAQMELGHARSLGLHLPVGILLVLLAAALLVGAWTPLGLRRGRAGR